jgi:predicted permease
MRRARVWFRRVLSLFQRGRLDREFAEELESHLQLHVGDGIRSGLSPEEARRQAVLRLGGIEPVKERQRDRRGLPFLESLGRDLAYAARMMRSHPGFTATVILTLGLGIGATTAIFTVVNGVLLRPLPYLQPDRLVYVSETLGGRPNPFTYTRDYAAFRDHNRTLSQIAGYMFFAANFTRGDRSERITGGLATRSFFDLLGVQPALGRNFLPEEDSPGGPPVAILSGEFWRNRLGADPSVVGRSVILDGRSYNIVGVLPRGFRVPGQYGGDYTFALWLPFAITQNRAARNEIMLCAVGRLKPGATLQQVRADLDALQQVKLRRGIQKGIVVSEWQNEITHGVRRSLLIFLCAAGFVLLMACINVANLLLSRAATREREMGIRRAIGAGRRRILQQLLTESALFGLLGGMLGLAFAYWGKSILVAFLAPNLPSLDPILIDRGVLFFNISVAVLTGIAFGLAPALQTSNFDVMRSLKESGRGSSDGRSPQRIRSMLVVSEVALAMVLLSGAGLFLKSFFRLRSVDGGYKSDHILMMTLDLTASKYKTATDQTEFFRQALERIGELPGVLAAGVTTSPPFSLYSYTLSGVILEGQPEASTSVDVAIVSPDYFRILGIPLVRGRIFSPVDRDGSPSVVVVNESFARRFYPNGDCLGKRIQNWDKENDYKTIVGVVGDVRTYPEDEAPPEIYCPYLQTAGTHMTIVVRTAGDPLLMSAAVRSRIAAVDNTQPPHDITTMEQAIDEHFTPRRVKMQLVVVFAVLALILGVVGIYGVLSYTVRRRTHEIAVRLALGAEPTRIIGMVMSRGMGMIASGIGIGLAASLALTRLISGELWGVSATDPWTLAAVALVLVASGLAACLMPALRAARADPMASLRRE